MIRLGFVRTLFASCALAALLSGCRGSESVDAASAVTPGPAKMDVVTVNFNPTLAYSPWAIGLEAGFFREEGIDLRLTSIDANSALVALGAGRMDLISTALRSGLFNMMRRGATIQIVADRGHAGAACAAGAFTAPVAMAASIDAAGGDLRGRKFVLYRGGITEYLVDRLLKSRNTPRDAIELTQVPQGDYTTLASQKLEAIRYMQEPTLTQMVNSGSVKVIARDEQFAPGNQHGVVLFGKRLLRDDPELGRRVMRAYLRSVRRYAEGKTESNIAVAAKHTKLSPELLRQTCWAEVSTDGMVKLEAIEDLLAWSRESGYLEGEIPRELWWNPSFIEAANRSLASASR